METILLRNKTTRTIIVPLSHAEVCKRSGSCRCQATGASSSLILGAGVTRSVDATVLFASTLQQHVAAGRVAVINPPPAAPAAAAVVVAPPAPKANEGAEDQPKDKRRKAPK